jgi:molecular chaperone HtpG
MSSSKPSSKKTDSPSSTSQSADSGDMAPKQTLGFQTEVKQLLQLMIHSLYSNREIFLRELISNASDACDKLRFMALNQDAIYEGDSQLAIELSFDKQARTLTISDNGIGMTRQEAIDNLGTIARSGTKEFFSQMTGDKAKDSNLIGQFGVGFYSAFIVADRVTVRSRKAGEPAASAVLWESDGSGEFSVEMAEKTSRGTEITLHLREADPDAAEPMADLLSTQAIRNIVRKYSDHISLPIRMIKENWDAEKSAYVSTGEFETVNQASALWTRSKSEITPEQYNEFYKSLSYDFADPLAYTHNRVEGRSEYTQLLFVPAKAPYDMWERGQKRGIKLYVKRVFIMDEAEQLMPAYLRFIKGVIDSNDLPLNVSREILQESRDVRAIREGSTKRVLSMLEDLAENKPEQYQTFWSEFGAVLKEGLGEDTANQERIAKLLRFASSDAPQGITSDLQTVSLSQYVARFKPEQEKIYYVTAETLKAARNSPHLEVFRAKGIEVLLLTDRVDEWMLSHLSEFEGKALVSVAKGGVDLGKLADANEKQSVDEATKTHEALLARMKEALKDKASDVKVTNRLVESPSCLVAQDGDMSGHLQRLLKQAGQNAPSQLPVLEINPKHPFVQQLDSQTDKFELWCSVLFDQALIAEGGQLEDPAAFVRSMNQLLMPAAGPAANPG